MTKETMTRCAHKGCTCHTQDGARYCSDSCRGAAESSANRDSGCACGHAGCTASAYDRARPTAAAHDSSRGPR